MKKKKKHDFVARSWIIADTMLAKVPQYQKHFPVNDNYVRKTVEKLRNIISFVNDKDIETEKHNSPIILGEKKKQNVWAPLARDFLARKHFFHKLIFSDVKIVALQEWWDHIVNTKSLEIE